jgi:hypothetical protein
VNDKQGRVCCSEPQYGQATTEALERKYLPLTKGTVKHLCGKLLQKADDIRFHFYMARYYTEYTLYRTNKETRHSGKN